MMTQSWIIGSQSGCQLVVEHPTVSGEHCRLIADGHSFLLEDLNSTNGTYVNGERLTTCREVKLSDRITLGKTHPMPWPVELKPAAKTVKNPIERSRGTYSVSVSDDRTASTRTVITIGRGPRNSVVLNESNISTQHARLTITPDRIILEDLGSTNGTSVGTVENKIHRAEIEKQDTIFFGSNAYSLFQLIQKHHGVKPAPSVTPARAPGPTTPVPSKTFTSLLPWIAGSLGTVAILLIGWIIFGRSNANDPTEIAGIKAASAQAAGNPESSHSKKSPASVSEEERLARSLFVLVASDAERKTPFRVGTGFAIDTRCVATTASVVSALHKLQENGYPETFLYCPATGQELEITDMIVHPGFHSAQEAAKSAQAEYESIMERYEVEPPSPENLESVKSRLLSVQEKAFRTFERKTTFDVAVVETSQSLKYWLAAVERGTSLRPNLKLNVRGLAHDVKDPFFDPQSLGAPEEMTSRVRQVMRVTRESPARLLAEADAQQREYAWFGSPVLNAQGQVVAVYSRPTPPATESDAADPPLTFDAPLFDRVRECLSEKP